MGKMKLSTREIGCVSVFDLDGDSTHESLGEIANKIQKQIRRHRMQRIILNLQRANEIDPIGMRRLMAACIRPHQSLIYGASVDALEVLKESYLPGNVKICRTEDDVAADFGPFLLEKESGKNIAREFKDFTRESIGHQVERRRSKRMHVAIPVELNLQQKDGGELFTRAIITNISEGGMFAEYLDTEQAEKIDRLDQIENLEVNIRIPQCQNFPEEYCVKGIVTRKELRKRQLGLAIKFLEK